MAEAVTERTAFRDRVAEALERVRPALRLDGQDVELVDVQGANALVRFLGACEG